MRRIYSLIELLLCISFSIYAQAAFTQALTEEIPLKDISAFKAQEGTWQIVGGITADLKKDNVFSTEAGTGILANVYEKGKSSNLFSLMEHGDIDLEFEFMMAKGANSGVYLQARYEIQLFDSWGEKYPSFGDVGGIYERWDNSKPEGKQGFQGYAPRVNVARAPGLWQKMKISFQAPTFDKDGNKIQNARILSIDLNGTRIHEQVELTGPTRGPAIAGEGTKGPLLIQGDHGAVAFRNIRYKTYEKSTLALKDLSYTYYQARLSAMPEFEKLKLLGSGKMDMLTHEVVPLDEFYVLRIKGNIELEESGTYVLRLLTRGSGYLKVGEKELLPFGWWDREATTDLAAGKHPIEIIYYKPEPQYPKGLGLRVSGPTYRSQNLHALASMPMDNPVNPIEIAFTPETSVRRSFIDYKEPTASKSRRIVHAISVGFSDGISMTFDPDRAAWVQAWKGGFLDATPMWNSRGDGSARPMGSILHLGDETGMRIPIQTQKQWPESFAIDQNYRFRGYELEGDTQTPAFIYELGETSFRDKVEVAADRKGFSRRVEVKGPQAANIQFKIGEASQVSKLSDRLFMLDQAYYIQLPSNYKGKVQILNEAGMQQLILTPASMKNENTLLISYSLLW